MSVTGETLVTRNNYLAIPERIVRPRSRAYRRLPVIAIHGDDTLAENGEVGTVNDLLANLPKYPPTLIVAISSGDLLARMDAIYSQFTPSAWQFRISNHERDITTPDGVKVATRVSVAIHYLGWKNGNYHKMIDPVTMYGQHLDRIWPERGIEVIARLLRWGIALRDFCDANGIEVRATTGGISAQFLTDPRFYPDSRRKVPGIINETCRERMPGNNYQLHAHTDDKEYTALYMDQSRAHHYHARTTALPDANLLYAHGDFIHLENIAFQKVPSQFHGLLCVDLERPDVESLFDWLPRTSLEKMFVWTNELPHILDMGYRVKGVRACWGSRKRDTGIPLYAQWAETQLDAYNDPAWLKPLLLSTYGVLASTPRYAESVFKLAKAGEEVKIRTGRHSITGRLTRNSVKVEPRIANVLQRGMIEAATRSESVGLAQHLTALGHRVLSIYADAVIIELDEHNPLPQLPPPWRSKGTLHHLQFVNKQAFTSGEMTKLPGIGKLGRSLRAHAPKPFNVAEEMEADEEAYG